MLERVHNFFDVIEAVTSDPAKRVSTTSTSISIYGLPEQTLANLANHRPTDPRPAPRTHLRLRLDPRTRHSVWTLGIKGTSPLTRPRPRRGHVRMAGGNPRDERLYAI
ncbi:MAG: hypothetical protein MZV64_23850 [Ignavibacteriales bacterium]|nr:hypothetical protein [Ignavibacteriales bacterium]